MSCQCPIHQSPVMLQAVIHPRFQTLFGILEIREVPVSPFLELFKVPGNEGLALNVSNASPNLIFCCLTR